MSMHLRNGLVGCVLALCGCGTDTTTGTVTPDGGANVPDGETFDASSDSHGFDALLLDTHRPDRWFVDVPIFVPDSGPPELTLATYPRVDGSTSTIPLAYVIACELLGLPWKWESVWHDANQAYLMQVVPSPQNTE